MSNLPKWCFVCLLLAQMPLTVFCLVPADPVELEHGGAARERLGTATCDSLVVVFEARPTCPLAQNGSVLAVPSGGTPPYFFVWENGSVADLRTGLDAGTYIVTITDALGCTVVDSLGLTVAERPTVPTQTLPVSCFGRNDGVLQILSDDPNLLFKVGAHPVSAQTVYENLWAGGDQFFVIDTLGCDWVQFFLIESPEKIQLSLPNNLRLENCDSAQILAEVSDEALQFSWLPTDHLSCADCSSPKVAPINSTTFYLTALDSNGCSATDSIQVTLDPMGIFNTPSAFSPNGDGVNDRFCVLGECILEVRLLRVFDRWGRVVFEKLGTPANDVQFGWDGNFEGKPAPSDVFVFQTTVEFYDGTVQSFAGDLTLLR